MNHFQLRRVFQRHYGASSKLAAQLGVNRTTIAKWLRGQITSRRIETAVRTKAAELLLAELEHGQPNDGA